MSKKQTSIYFEQEFIEDIKVRSEKEHIKMNDLIVNSVEGSILYPFLNWRHLYNYLYIKRNLDTPLKGDSSRDALFYIIAFDGICMEYFNEIYTIENRQEGVRIPDELNDLLHPNFCLLDGGIQLFSEGTINEMEYALDWLANELDEIKIFFNAVMICNKAIVIKDEFYRFKKLNLLFNIDVKPSYSIDEYIKSSVFEMYSEPMKEIIQKLSLLIQNDNIPVIIRPSQNDILTFSLTTTERKRIALCSQSCNGSSLNIGINKLDSNPHGNILSCQTLHDLEELIYDDLTKKYKEITNEGDMK